MLKRRKGEITMRSIRRVLTMMFCLFLGAIVLVGCSSNKYADSKYLGEWKATSASASGISISVESAIGGEMVFNLEASGKCVLTIAGDDSRGKWEETDNGFTVEDEYKFEVDGDHATMETGGVTFEFERKSS